MLPVKIEPRAELESALPAYKAGTSPYMFTRLIVDGPGIEPGKCRGSSNRRYTVSAIHPKRDQNENRTHVYYVLQT